MPYINQQAGWPNCQTKMADYKTAVDTHGFYSTEAKTACQALVDSLNHCGDEAGLGDVADMQQFGY